MADKEPRCNFCGKHKNATRILIAGAGAYICDECVLLALECIGDVHYRFYAQIKPDEEY